MVSDKNIHVVKSATDMALTLLEQAGIAIYERDPLAHTFLQWMTEGKQFAGGGSLPSMDNSAFNFRTVVHPDDIANFVEKTNEAIQEDGTYNIEYRMHLADDRYVWVRDVGRIEKAITGMPLHARGILTFIEPYIQRAEMAEFAARYDTQTGRPNRRFFDKTISEFAAAKKQGAVLIISIDNMTFLNEALGPMAVNDLLQAAAQRLDRLVPSNAIIARTGGDSFGVWLADHDSHAAADNGQHIIEAFRAEHFVTQECAVNVSVSIGAVTIPDLASEGIEALTRAEQALKTGRTIGRGIYRFYEASEDRRSNNLAYLSDIDRFRKAMAAKDLVLSYQPIVNAMDGRISFYEALLRLRQSDGSFSSAFKLIQAFEQAGLMHELDRYVVGMAFEALRQEPELKLSVNLSASTVSSHHFQDMLHGELMHKPDLAQRLIWEITETAAINDLTDARRFVDMMHEVGSKVALDDYGAGYTSLQHLQQLNVDKVKIDGSLIKGIKDNAQNQVMVKSILAMAQNMGVETVAEFVETEHEAAWLQRHGANFMQGWFFGAAVLELPTKASSEEKASAFLQATGMLTLAV